MTHRCTHNSRAPGLAALLLSLSLTPALAQEGNVPPTGNDAPASAEDCRALLEQPDGETQAAPEDLSERLARCDGVLAPPAEGDPAILTPPPDTGTTPVIPPEAAPDQAPG